MGPILTSFCYYRPDADASASGASAFFYWETDAALGSPERYLRMAGGRLRPVAEEDLARILDGDPEWQHPLPPCAAWELDADGNLRVSVTPEERAGVRRGSRQTPELTEDARKTCGTKRGAYAPQRSSYSHAAAASIVSGVRITTNAFGYSPIARGPSPFSTTAVLKSLPNSFREIPFRLCCFRLRAMRVLIGFI